MTKLNAPAGIIIYGGVGSFTARSADGTMYVVYCGDRPGLKFGTHIYRILANGATEWINYAPFTESRVECSVEPDGLYISYGSGDPARAPERVKIPGYVTPPFPGGTHTLPPTPVTITATDNTARDAISRLTNSVASDLARTRRELEAKIKAIPQQKVLTEQEILDRIWTKSGDRFYAELNNSESPVSNLIEQMIRRILAGK
jgi:hypothetical protein